MDQKEFDALIEKLEEKTGAKIDGKITEALKGLEGIENLDVDAVKALLDASAGQTEKVEQLEETVKNLGLELTAIKEDGTPSKKEGEFIKFMNREGVEES